MADSSQRRPPSGPKDALTVLVSRRTVPIIVLAAEEIPPQAVLHAPHDLTKTRLSPTICTAAAAAAAVISPAIIHRHVVQAELREGGPFQVPEAFHAHFLVGDDAGSARLHEILVDVPGVGAEPVQLPAACFDVVGPSTVRVAFFGHLDRGELADGGGDGRV